VVPDNVEDWARVRATVRSAIGSSLHCTIGSRNPDGSVHLTPIGSIVLTEQGKGLYLDLFNRQLGENLDADPRVTILAVHSGRLMWLRSLLGSSFVRPPGVRLTGRVGPRRPSTTAEVKRFHRAVWPLIHAPGGRYLWWNAPFVRDIEFDGVVPLRIGRMTEGADARIEPARWVRPEP
jgi:uncharacterized protein